jgi:hypothetical protein
MTVSNTNHIISYSVSFGFPNGWETDGPFGIWNHPDGSNIVNLEPGYLRTRPDGTKKEFGDLYVAMTED